MSMKTHLVVGMDVLALDHHHHHRVPIMIVTVYPTMWVHPLVIEDQYHQDRTVQFMTIIRNHHHHLEDRSVCVVRTPRVLGKSPQDLEPERSLLEDTCPPRHFCNVRGNVWILGISSAGHLITGKRLVAINPIQEPATFDSQRTSVTL